MIDLTSKLGEINDIEHKKGSKMYPQNQVILDCIMSSIPLKHSCLSIILIWVIVSHNHKNIGFLGNTGPDPLKNHKSTKNGKPAFNVGPSNFNLL